MKKTVYIGFILVAMSCNGPDTASTRYTDTSAPVAATVPPDTPLTTTNPASLKTTNKEEPADMASEDAVPAPRYIKTPSPQGIYHAVLPCSNCKGIDHIVAFYPDNTYRIEEESIGKDTTLFDKTTGDWKPTSGVIWLYKDQVVRARYTWKDDTLMYLNPATKIPIPLHKLKPATENEAWRNKKQEGIAFFGVGNEPFWNIEITNKNTITFHLAEKDEPVQFLHATSADSEDSVIYHSQNDSASLKAVIYHRFCSDGMSDYIYNEKVTVQYNDQTFHGCGILYK